MTDHLATTYAQARDAQEADRARRGVRLCACGGEYRDTADGRRTHQTLHGHAVTPEGGRTR